MAWRAVMIAVLLAGGAALLADEPATEEKDAAKNEEVVALVDGTGKELKLTNVKLTTGTRRLAFLADHKGTTDEARKGPSALEVREPHSTTFAKGVVTLIPLSCVESVNYDYAKQSMTVAVKGQPEVPGTLQFRGINAIALEGKNGDVLGKFSSGVPKDGFRSIAWPSAKPMPSRPAGGTAWSVQIVQPLAKDPMLAVRNLKALYSFPGGVEQLIEALPVRKGEPLHFDAKLKKLELIAVDQNTHMAALEVTIEGGMERLIAVPLTLEQDKRTGTLIGLVGEVDSGWKLFPLHAIKVVKPAG